MNVGHLTLLIMSIFLNLSLIMNCKYFPAASFTMSLIEVNGDINNNEQGLCYDAKYVAGPVPIDLPKRMMEDSSIP
jgi:hypothetical protein